MASAFATSASCSSSGYRTIENFRVPSFNRSSVLPRNSTLERNSLLGRHPTFKNQNAETRKRIETMTRAAAKELQEADFEKEVLQASIPVLVDFWAPWCGPCKLIVPAINSLSEEYEGRLKVFKVEADPNPVIVEQYKVYGLPALIVFHGGEVIARHEGALPKLKIKQFIDNSLELLAAKQ